MNLILQFCLEIDKKEQYWNVYCVYKLGTTMDYFNGYGLPRLSRDFSTGDQHHQQVHVAFISVPESN